MHHTETEKAVRTLIEAHDPDPDREGLRETPKRVAQALQFWTQGYSQNPRDVLKEFEDGAQNYDELVFEGNLPLFSLCEHHLTPFFGVAHIGYIPNKKIVGLSKLGRLLDIFAQRFQVQERLTSQVANALNEHLNPKAVGVVIRARHLCMESRGIRKVGTITFTSTVTGLFKQDAAAREEFLSFVRLADTRASTL